MRNVTHEDFCLTFDSILQNLSTDELRRLSARRIDVEAVKASRRSSNSKKEDECIFTVDLVTAVGWLDTLDVCIKTIRGDEEITFSEVTVSLAATGFLPLIIPGASLCNIFLCWVPFLSVEQTQRLDFFKEKINAVHSIENEELLCNF